MNKLDWARFLFNILRWLPKKYPVQSPSGLTQQPFFVFGSGRNGSTLLNRLLNTHDQINIPSEQYFLGPAIFKFRFYNYILWRDLVKVLMGELLVSARSHRWELSSFPDLSEIFTWSKEQKSLQSILSIIYQSVNEHNKRYWGDTTHLNTLYADEIVDTFPEGKYFFLLRDGRDVVASFKKGRREVFEERADILIAAKQWKASIETYRNLKGKVAIRLIKYEDLVSDPERILKSICSDIGVSFQPEMLQFHTRLPNRDIYQQAIHQNLHQPISGSSIGKYKGDLTQEDLETILPIINKELKQYNYL